MSVYSYVPLSLGFQWRGLRLRWGGVLCAVLWHLQFQKAVHSLGPAQSRALEPKQMIGITPQASAKCGSASVLRIGTIRSASPV